MDFYKHFINSIDYKHNGVRDPLVYCLLPKKKPSDINVPNEKKDNKTKQPKEKKDNKPKQPKETKGNKLKKDKKDKLPSPLKDLAEEIANRPPPEDEVKGQIPENVQEVVIPPEEVKVDGHDHKEGELCPSCYPPKIKVIFVKRPKYGNYQCCPHARDGVPDKLYICADSKKILGGQECPCNTCAAQRRNPYTQKAPEPPVVVQMPQRQSGTPSVLVQLTNRPSPARYPASYPSERQSPGHLYPSQTPVGTYPPQRQSENIYPGPQGSPIVIQSPQRQSPAQIYPGAQGSPMVIQSPQRQSPAQIYPGAQGSPMVIQSPQRQSPAQIYPGAQGSPMVIQSPQRQSPAQIYPGAQGSPMVMQSPQRQSPAKIYPGAQGSPMVIQSPQRQSPAHIYPGAQGSTVVIQSPQRQSPAHIYPEAQGSPVVTQSPLRQSPGKIHPGAQGSTLVIQSPQRQSPAHIYPEAQGSPVVIQSPQRQSPGKILPKEPSNVLYPGPRQSSGHITVAHGSPLQQSSRPSQVQLNSPLYPLGGSQDRINQPSQRQSVSHHTLPQEKFPSPAMIPQDPNVQSPAPSALKVEKKSPGQSPAPSVARMERKSPLQSPVISVMKISEKPPDVAEPHAPSPVMSIMKGPSERNSPARFHPSEQSPGHVSVVKITEKQSPHLNSPSYIVKDAKTPGKVSVVRVTEKPATLQTPSYQIEKHSPGKVSVIKITEQPPSGVEERHSQSKVPSRIISPEAYYNANVERQSPRKKSHSPCLDRTPHDSVTYVRQKPQCQKMVPHDCCFEEVIGYDPYTGTKEYTENQDECNCCQMAPCDGVLNRSEFCPCGSSKPVYCADCAEQEVLSDPVYCDCIDFDDPMYEGQLVFPHGHGRDGLCGDCAKEEQPFKPSLVIETTSLHPVEEVEKDPIPKSSPKSPAPKRSKSPAKRSRSQKGRGKNRGRKSGGGGCCGCGKRGLFKFVERDSEEIANQ